MQNSTYQKPYLEKGSKKHICPNCNKRRFKRYVSPQTNDYIHETVGICDRINSCAYHYPPKQFYKDNNINFKDNNNAFNVSNFKPKPNVTITDIKPKTLLFVPKNEVLKTLDKYDSNNYINYLVSLYGTQKVIDLLKTYHIGTKQGKTVFWYRDVKQNFRTSKVMQYAKNGKRAKAKYPFYSHTSKDGFSLCLYGEHLLKGNNKTAIIVESEKNANVGFLEYGNKFVWLSSGGANGLTDDKIKVLANRDVILICDCDKAGRTNYNKAKIKLEKLCISVKIIELCQNLDNGFDVSDLLFELKTKELTAEKQKQTIKQMAKPQAKKLDLTTTIKAKFATLPKLEKQLFNEFLDYYLKPIIDKVGKQKLRCDNDYNAIILLLIDIVLTNNTDKAENLILRFLECLIMLYKKYRLHTLKLDNSLLDSFIEVTTEPATTTKAIF